VASLFQYDIAKPMSPTVLANPPAPAFHLPPESPVENHCHATAGHSGTADGRGALRQASETVAAECHGPALPGAELCVGGGRPTLEGADQSPLS